MSFFSDENLKQDITEIDPQEAAAKYKDMPVSSWRYKPDIGLGDAMHIGPMAQDFAAAFGGDGHTIKVQDAIGSQAAAIKGLAQQVAELKRGRK
nr:tail fiber domain-containing protein [Burkholderia contaminans]